MADKPILTHDAVSQLISYDPETGALTWLERPLSMFDSARIRNTWNSRFANRPAGYASAGHCVQVTFRCFNTKVTAHRLAFLLMNGEWPSAPIDHINGDPTDNRWANLRLCTIAQNNRNRRKVETVSGVRTSSPYRGVYFYRPTKKFVVHIRIPNPEGGGRGRQIHVGYYRSEIEAAKAYDKVALLYHGRFARLNFP